MFYGEILFKTKMTYYSYSIDNCDHVSIIYLERNAIRWNDILRDNLTSQKKNINKEAM